MPTLFPNYIYRCKKCNYKHRLERKVNKKNKCPNCRAENQMSLRLVLAYDEQEQRWMYKKAPNREEYEFKD